MRGLKVVLGFSHAILIIGFICLATVITFKLVKTMREDNNKQIATLENTLTLQEPIILPLGYSIESINATNSYFAVTVNQENGTPQSREIWFYSPSTHQISGKIIPAR